MIEGKADIKRKFILDSIKVQADEVKKTRPIKEFEDFNIIRFLKMSQGWIHGLKEIGQKILDLKELVILYPLPADKKSELESCHTTLTMDLRQSVYNREKEDKTCQLNTLLKKQSKDSIPYPVFKSQSDEDLHGFINNF